MAKSQHIEGIYIVSESLMDFIFNTLLRQFPICKMRYSRRPQLD